MDHQLGRRRSYDSPGHAHGLTFTCYQRYRFLAAEGTYRWLAEAIDRSRSRLGFTLWAYVFMPEHVHLIVYPTRPGCRVSSILHAIKQPVGRRAIHYLETHAPHWLPRITRERGDRLERLFWQSGGGFDRNITTATALESSFDYIHMNPVRRELAERPSDWIWSSAGWFDEREPNGLRPDSIPADWWR